MGVSCPDSVELIVFAKSSLNGLHTAEVRGGVKDIKVLILTVNKRVDLCAFLGVIHLWLTTFERRMCRVYTPSLL